MGRLSWQRLLFKTPFEKKNTSIATYSQNPNKATQIKLNLITKAHFDRESQAVQKTDLFSQSPYIIYSPQV